MSVTKSILHIMVNLHEFRGKICFNYKFNLFKQAMQACRNINKPTIMVDEQTRWWNYFFFTSIFISFTASTSTAQKSTPPTRAQRATSSDSGDETDQEESESSHHSARKQSRSIQMRRPSIMAAGLKSQHYGSFYLRMGAVGNYNFTSLCEATKLDCLHPSSHFTSWNRRVSCVFEGLSETDKENFFLWSCFKA